MYEYDGGSEQLNNLRVKLGECPKCHGPLVKVKLKSQNTVCFLCYAYRQSEPL